MKFGTPRAEEITNGTKAVGTKAVAGTAAKEPVQKDPEKVTKKKTRKQSSKQSKTGTKEAKQPRKPDTKQLKTRDDYIVAIFDAADRNSDGLIDRAEMFKVAQLCGFDASEEEFQEEWEDICENINDAQVGILLLSC